MNPYVLKTLGHMLNDTELVAPVQVVTIAMKRPAPQENFLQVKELPESVPVLAFTKEQQDTDVFQAANKNVACMPREGEDGKIERLGKCEEKMQRDTIVYTPDGKLCYVLNSDVIGLYQHHCSIVNAVNLAGEGDCSARIDDECTLSRSTQGPSTTAKETSAANFISSIHVMTAVLLSIVLTM